MKTDCHELIFQITNTKICMCYGKKEYKSTILREMNYDDKLTNSCEGSSVLLHREDYTVIVVGVAKKNNTLELNKLLIHELSHTVSQIMENYGITCDEFRSRSLEYLYGVFMSYISKKEKL